MTIRHMGLMTKENIEALSTRKNNKNMTDKITPVFVNSAENKKKLKQIITKSKTQIFRLK